MDVSNCLFLMKSNCKRFTTTVFGTVHSDRTVVVLLHKQTDLTHSLIPSTVQPIVRTLLWVSLALPQHFQVDFYANCIFSTDCLSPIFYLDCT